MSSKNSVFIVLIVLVFVTLGSAVLLDYGCKQLDKNALLFGENASPVPWMAYLMKDGTFICGGSLISHSLVLTAAHCVNSVDNLIVRLGEYNTTDNIPAFDFQVSAIDKHFTNDIALLKLRNEVLYTKNIMPVCILSKGLYNSLPTVNNFFVTGWGTTSDTNKRSSSTVLQQMNAERMHPPQCEDIEGQICCRHPLDKQFICNGDSGSPLVAYIDYNDRTQIAVQYGVVSSTSDLCRDHAYYVDVNKYSSWIFLHKTMARFRKNNAMANKCRIK